MEVAKQRFHHKPQGYEMQLGHDYNHGRWKAIARNVAPGTLLTPIRFILSPLIDGFGAVRGRTWGGVRHCRLHTENDSAKAMTMNAGTSGALSEFFDTLCADPDLVNQLDITLIGHSMGAILVNKIIRRYGEPLNIDRIVYMSAACTVRDYHDTVLPYMVDHPKTEMYHLVLHELSEQDEKLWKWFDVIPGGSLLVWLDNYMDKPQTRLDRMCGRHVNLLAMDHLVIEANERSPTPFLNRIHVKQFDYGEKAPANNPQKHGDFGNITFWRKEFWAPNVTNGYERITR